MRHRKSFNHLGRTRTHRKAMLSNLASSLILHKRITTTVAKAKALRMYVEPLITRAKEDTTHSRRVVFSYLQNKEAVNELFREVSKKVGDRPGGYTRILKLGQRLGDNTDLAFMELVDYNENLLSERGTSQGKSKRRRRGRGGKKTTTGQEAPKAETVAESVEEKAEDNAAVDPVKEETVAKEMTAPEAKTEKKAEETLAEEKAGEPKAEAKEASNKKAEPKKEEAKPKAEAEKKLEEKPEGTMVAPAKEKKKGPEAKKDDASEKPQKEEK